jgi:hypothetical protein
VPAWTPSRQPGAPPRTAQCAVRPLFDICLALVSEYIDDVESLWGLPDAIKASSVTPASRLAACKKYAVMGLQRTLQKDASPKDPACCAQDTLLPRHAPMWRGRLCVPVRARETIQVFWWQVRLAAAVGQQRRMSRDAAALFTEGAPAEVVLPDCTALEPGALAAALQDCATPRCVEICPRALPPFDVPTGC